MSELSVILVMAGMTLLFMLERYLQNKYLADKAERGESIFIAGKFYRLVESEEYMRLKYHLPDQAKEQA